MGNKIGNSLKWSTAGEFFSKLVTPITNMILARLLAPEDFGVLATVNMIITFVDLFTDSGFAKYIIQCDFENKEETEQYVNVAFWTNLFLSVGLWGLISIFRNPISRIVGNEGHEIVIVVASTQLMITSFSSIQTALYRRHFEFKELFVARIIMALIPIIVTVPLSYLMRNYWALIIGSIMQQLVMAIYLSAKSRWKPRFYYDVQKLYKMLSYSIWSLCEALAYWLSTWFDVFVIGASFSIYYLGIYKNSLNMVNSVMQLIKASIIPVLFSSLSRLKDNSSKFTHIYDLLQETAAIVLIPLGVGIFMFKETATLILFGEKWLESSMIIGVWALSASLGAVFTNFYGEAFKAKGIPKVLFFYEVLCLLIMIPICLIFKQSGFWPFVYSRAAVVFVQIALGFYFMKKHIDYPVMHMLKNIFPAVCCTLVMIIIGEALKHFLPNTLLFQILSVIGCMITYFFTLKIFFNDKMQDIINIIFGKNEVIQDEQIVK